jgi:hypothetical protein
MCRGNHELSILRHLEVDLTGRLCKRLRQYNPHVIDAGYRGWIKFRFTDLNKDDKSSTEKGQTTSFNFYTTHGGNSNAVVTKGILQAGRRGVIYPDADVVLQGNIHESWLWEIPRSRLSRSGKERADIQTHICIPTYKDEFFGDSSGYHHLKERPPKPIGAWWCRFYWDNDERRVKYSFERAR